MKKQIAKFISNNFIRIIIYPSLLSVYVSDSMIALTFYSITIHIMTISLCIGLYIKENKIIDTEITKWLSFSLLETIFFLIILATIKHWYTFIITVIYSLLISAYLYDRVAYKKPIKEEEEDYRSIEE